MSRFFASVVFAFVFSLLALAGARAEIALPPDDTILFYWNSMVERLDEHGELEALVQLANPEKKLHFRSFA